ncbi:MAG: protein kinase [Polyangiaceae bacterium]|nr:protein kinase [Polyangiaceae bacterium]
MSEPRDALRANPRQSDATADTLVAGAERVPGAVDAPALGVAGDPHAAVADTVAAPPKAVGAVGPVDRDAATLDGPVEPARSSREGLALSLRDAERYEVISEIARGGLGRILRATDKRLRRPVALKELLSPQSGSEARFLQEAQITARLQHPSIIPLYDAGYGKAGDLFYSMKLVFGDSLEEVIYRKKNLTERLSLLPHVIDVAEAIAYAHSKKIIHRDLKPQNVLVGEFGETVVIDWGIAKDLSSEGADSGSAAPNATGLVAQVAGVRTLEGTVMGTPAYMPPEQARGESVDEHADVYALGAILYHTLAGVPPYDEPELRDILQKLLANPTVPPPPLEERVRGVPNDLRAIVAKAMAPKPSERYPSARELAADLKKFQTGQIVGAYQYTTRELVLRWLGRNKLVTTLVGILAVGGVLSVVSILDRSRAAEEGRKAAVLAQQKAEEAEARERTRADEVTLEQARMSLEHDPQRSLDFLANLSPAFPRISAARVIASDSLSRTLPITLRGHTGGVFRAAFSPDGKLVASVGYDKTLRVWNLETRAMRVFTGHTAEVLRLAFLPDGKRVVTASYDRTLRLWDLESGNHTRLEGHTDWLSEMILSNDGKTLVSAAADKTVRVWNLADSPPTSRVFAGHDERVVALDLSPDGERILTTSTDGTVRVWNVLSAKHVVIARNIGVFDPRAHFSPDGLRAVVSDYGQRVVVVDLKTNKLTTFAQPTIEVQDAIFLPDNRSIAFWAGDGTIGILDSESGKTLATLRGHSGQVVGVAVSADGKKVYSGGVDHTLRVWDVATGDSQILRAHSAPITHISLSAQGDRILSTGSDETVRVWTPAQDGNVVISTGAPALFVAPLGANRLLASTVNTEVSVCAMKPPKCDVLEPSSGELARVAVSPDRRMAAVPKADFSIAIWDVYASPPKLIQTLVGHSASVSEVVFAADATSLASVSADGSVRLWEPATGKHWVFKGQMAGATPVRLTISADGKWIATYGAEKNNIELWETGTGNSTVLKGHESLVMGASFSTDGSQLVTTGLDRTARIWNVYTKEARIFSASDGGLFSARFSPTGGLLATASDGGVVRLWNMETGNSRALRGHELRVGTVAFSPDGKTLASGSADYTVRLWDVATGETRALRGGRDIVRTVAFTTDGKMVCAALADATIRCWPDELPHEEPALREKIKSLASVPVVK